MPAISESSSLSLRDAVSELGEVFAVFDSRTTVFTLGRMIEVFLLERHPDHAARPISAGATRADPAERPSSVAALQQAWRAAV